MKKYIKKAWIKALRSGEYKQGHKRLCRTFNGEDLYCCLGVLANECADGYWVSVSDLAFDDDDSITWGFVRHDGDDDALPEDAIIFSLEKELGIDKRAMSMLAGMNDVGGLDFEQIADWIEESL
jgi:hypothetical protein